MKTSTTKSLKNIKFLFVSRGPGETGQARALAKLLEENGAKIIFCLHQEKNKFFLKDDKEFSVFLTPTPADLKNILEKQKPKFLFLFNSKMWSDDFKKNPPFKKPDFVFCFDSNWLFNQKKYPRYKYVEWADKYFILFPKKIFELGLKENGGNFEIEKKIKEKVLPVGFIPAYKPIREKEKIRKKLAIKKNEKFIFSYFSGWGAGHRIWALEKMIKAVDVLIKKKNKIRVIYVGPIADLSLEKIKRNWLILKEKMSAKEFFITLASSDLVFMHQGMVTLAQAVGCKIPAILNVSVLKKEIPWLHFAEVLPFKKAGICEMFSEKEKIKNISRTIEELLFNKNEIEKMSKKQSEIFEDGERRVFEEIKKLL